MNDGARSALERKILAGIRKETNWLAPSPAAKNWAKKGNGLKNHRSFKETKLMCVCVCMCAHAACAFFISVDWWVLATKLGKNVGSKSVFPFHDRLYHERWF